MCWASSYMWQFIYDIMSERWNEPLTWADGENHDWVLYKMQWSQEKGKEKIGCPIGAFLMTGNVWIEFRNFRRCLLEAEEKGGHKDACPSVPACSLQVPMWRTWAEKKRRKKGKEREVLRTQLLCKVLRTQLLLPCFHSIPSYLFSLVLAHFLWVGKLLAYKLLVKPRGIIIWQSWTV